MNLTFFDAFMTTAPHFFMRAEQYIDIVDTLGMMVHIMILYDVVHFQSAEFLYTYMSCTVRLNYTVYRYVNTCSQHICYMPAALGVYIKLTRFLLNRHESHEKVSPVLAQVSC